MYAFNENDNFALQYCTAEFPFIISLEDNKFEH